MTYKVFVISLKDNNVQRRNNVVEQLSEIDMPFEFIDAVNGHDLDVGNDTRISPEAHAYRPGHLGCSLSHMVCYSKVLDENLDFAVILEDDLLIMSRFSHYLKRIFDYMDGQKSVTFLYVNTFPSEQLIIERRKDLNLSPNDVAIYEVLGGRPNCTTAYIISKESCRAMLERQFPIQTVADDFEQFQNQGAIEHLYVLYPLAIGIAPFASQIAQDSYGRLQKLLKLISRIPMLPDFFVLYRNWLANKSDTRFIIRK